MNSVERVKQHRVLMATDVPFWRKSTGAEQRMEALVRFLKSESFAVRTFFLGQTDTDQFTQHDRGLIASGGLDVQQKSSEQLPQGFAGKIGWYADATIHRLKQMSGLKSNESAKPGDVCSEDSAPRLEDYRWPWAISAFAETIKDFDPGSIIIQYIKLSYLLEALTISERASINCMIDTHDVLHLRAEQFHERGLHHWIELSRKEESEALIKFDTIIAIQPEEAQLFREMAPECQTIVCGHAAHRALVSESRNRTAGQLTVGYVGSANASNAQAIRSFLEQVWPRLQASKDRHEFRLVIAGSICDWIEQQKIETNQLNNVQLLGHVECLDSFYDPVDILINPVEFGTGLKIKNCEALAFGKPVITTAHGMVGMPGDCEIATQVCNSAEAFYECLIELSQNPTRLGELQAAATKLSQTEFSERHVYSELKQAIRSEK